MSDVARRRYQLEHVDDLAEIRAFVEQAALAAGGDEDAVGDLVLVVNEAVTNVLVHGYENRPGELLVEVRRLPDGVQVVLEDQAPVFDPTTAPRPDITLPLEQRPFGGLGVHMMREFTDEMNYQITESGGNRLVFVKRQPGAG